MDHLWIALAILGAGLQAVRTAAQRQLNAHMSVLATTYVRSLLGLPVMLVWLALISIVEGARLPSTSLTYLTYTLLGAIAQVLATMLLVSMFHLRNFAIGTMLTKVDVVTAAIIGALFFSETLTVGGVVALLVVLAGMGFISMGRIFSKSQPSGETIAGVLTGKASQVALMCALAFSMSYLFFREAALNITGGTFLWRAAWTVALATLMQTVLVGLWMWRTEPASFTAVWPNRGLSTFIGTTSAIGSISWFTAFALQNASYVRAVGQVEVVFTVLISALYFRERVLPLEYAGIALTVAGIVLFRLVA
jgi:drug/metabolite transporter (DMT)-like permease